ncbi:MAG: DUF1192 domain-containing protein [Magnetospirillum sp.]|nr:DUF1192 domain-containing protein [Magnetospirillum sp.]
MDWEDLEPRRKAPAPKNLETMSVEELGEYISQLEAEIARAKAAIAAKRSVRAGADALFKR